MFHCRMQEALASLSKLGGEVGSARFFAEACDEGEEAGDDEDGNGEVSAVASEALVGLGQKHRVAGGDQVAELIGEAGKGGAHGAGRELAEVGGDHTPGSLNHELHEEGSASQRERGTRERVERDHGEGEQGGGDDGALAAEALGQSTEEDAPEACADVVN